MSTDPTNTDDTIEEIVMSKPITTPTQASAADSHKKTTIDPNCCTVPPTDPGPTT